jgi:hypothetical protein
MTIDEIIFAILMIVVVGIVLWDTHYGEPVIEEDENDHFY